MNKPQWLITETKWFVKASRSYMQGEKVTPYRAVRAYFRYMSYSYRDFKSGIHTPTDKRAL